MKHILARILGWRSARPAPVPPPPEPPAVPDGAWAFELVMGRPAAGSREATTYDLTPELLTAAAVPPAPSPPLPAPKPAPPPTRREGQIATLSEQGENIRLV